MGGGEEILEDLAYNKVDRDILGRVDMDAKFKKWWKNLTMDQILSKRPEELGRMFSAAYRKRIIR